MLLGDGRPGRRHGDHRRAPLPRPARSGPSRRGDVRYLLWAAGITFLLCDWAATLELGRSALRGLSRSGDRIAVGFFLYLIADAPAAQPETPAIIKSAAETNMVELITSIPGDQLDRNGDSG
jgi:hypothetical protein